VTPEALAQTVAAPLIEPAAAGTPLLTVTARLFAVPLPQTLAGVTVTLPEVVPQVTVMDTVPWPAVMVAPPATLHV